MPSFMSSQRSGMSKKNFSTILFSLFKSDSYVSVYRSLSVSFLFFCRVVHLFRGVFTTPLSPPPFSVRIQGTYSSNEITCQQFCDMIAIPYRIWLISTIRYFSDVRVGADTEEQLHSANQSALPSHLIIVHQITFFHSGMQNRCFHVL